MKAYISAKNNISATDLLEVIREDLAALPEEIMAYKRQLFMSKEVQDFILECNRRLLSQGLRPDLTPISKIPEGNQSSKYYERYTIYNRSNKGLQTQVVDLEETGFFYKSITVKAGSDELIEFSTDPKSPELERVWGDILGISNDDLYELVKIIKPKIVKFVRDKLKRQR